MKIEISPDYQYMAKELFDIPRMFDEEQGEIVYSGRNFVRRFIIQGTPALPNDSNELISFNRLHIHSFAVPKQKEPFAMPESSENAG